MSKPKVALVQVSSCFHVPGTLWEQWYFTAVFIEEPGKVQITQILNVKKGWVAEEQRHLFVAMECDWFLSSYPGVVSSSMRGDADTINLFFIIKGQMRHLFWVETKQLEMKRSNADLMNALLFDVSGSG